MTTSCQRWRERRALYRRPEGERFDPKIHAVDVIDRNTAKAFTLEHHYAGTFPSNRINVGLFRGRSLVGVSVVSVPDRFSVTALTGLPTSAGVTIGRFVLLEGEECNAETWLLARVFKLIRRELAGVRVAISFSDPHPRRTSEGRLVMPGHYGLIYQSANAIYTGVSKPRTIWLAPNGQEVPPRSARKFCNGERGDAGVYKRLRELGAPPIRPLEDPASYYARALREGPFRAERHPGNHRYCWALDPGVRVNIPKPLPYPKPHASIAM